MKECSSYFITSCSFQDLGGFRQMSNLINQRQEHIVMMCEDIARIKCVVDVIWKHFGSYFAT